MAFSLSSTDLPNARYALVHRSQLESHCVGASLGTFQLYCETWADVKDRLRFNLKPNSGLNWVRRPEQWYAAACQQVCWNRRRPFYIAVQRYDDGTYGSWYVVALKPPR